MPPQRFAFVGTGGRAMSFIEPLVTTYRATNELVALCDLSPARLAYYNGLLAGAWGYHAVPAYPADRFDAMLAETKPDVVFVCSKDSTHHDYIIRALLAGCDVITEKPLTIDAAKCQAILEAQRASGRRVRVAFNYRWGPFRTKVRELLAAGTIGRVHSVNLEYLLDTNHGADYFRRWHAHAADSGTLLVHKSTHHFDLVNWWLDAIPAQVFAYGDLVFYGRRNAEARGDGHLAAYPRYTGEPRAKGDPFRLDLDESESFRGLYRAAEADSGYLRDRNVFRDDIDIFDQMSLNVRYRTGEVLTYSLTAYSPREGMRVTMNGDRGRLEYSEFIGTHMNRAVRPGDFKIEDQPGAEAEGESIRIYPHFQPSYLVPLPPASGAHGGADAVLCHSFFSPDAPATDPFQRFAGHEQGAASILVGIAAVESIKRNLPVNLTDLVPLVPAATKLSELV
ncbi:Gfo/Idh/MocA family oxidoreductase [Horticoccus luteus]|uniref:Gfo/Idh/MocA family oxidoreductase n=1 Tax=Horticoccus luteus TaxID=2862869 RepID=A0A8F9XK18_9BACT|nr:Gfo/Idh/MocA family oxidoreductase [Horticoccus luteus]QYM77741.1 Gfo/Idh/MocA family oxidoreductase [Horticoccus luteus]